MTYPSDGDDPNEIWKHSFVAPESDEASPAMQLFAIGCQLSELTCDLKEPTENRGLIDALSRDWGNLREVVGATDVAAQPGLIEAVRDHFCQTLCEVAVARADLEPKCSDLMDRLCRFAQRATEQET